MIFAGVNAAQHGIVGNDGADIVVQEVISAVSSSISGGETTQAVDRPHTTLSEGDPAAVRRARLAVPGDTASASVACNACDTCNAKLSGRMTVQLPRE